MPDDAIEARIPASCPVTISEILRRAWHHDLAGLKALLSVPGRASVQEPTTGETPLHAAIRSCGARTQKNNNEAPAEKSASVDIEAAKAVVHELFLSGAIWNDVDSNNETPGCVAARLAQDDLYNECVSAGMRAELLFGLLDGYEALDSDAEEEDEDNGEDKANNREDAATNEDTEHQDDAPEDIILESDPDRAFLPPQTEGTVTSAAYLRANLTYTDGKLVDDQNNGVMMAWETSIMRSSVDALLPGLPAGKRILNIGFGMGIIDGMFRETQPSRHHIVEAHPEVLKHVETSPDCTFGKDWEASASEGAYKIYAGKWQEVVPGLLEQGELYDAIYFDTFGEDYSQLRMFFTEYVPALLDEGGIFGFFNGLGADRKVCYDVYTKVVEMHLADAGLDIEWNELDVDMKGLEKEGKGEWSGVKRRYWTLDKYRLPVITLMG
ncbi:arginine N-methyltransferase 2 [Xylaria bambusicola]|uniref:arginine N-methyltransferase 2 n=1 Tax=Xylaria bambusicola TaxID=326684 RepID=UPI0020081696|nr:arginine N-methyltransferase 2 [Xylaria bambusicola]KAI0515198.1 arginine N-methyltransferase 2 [Xylaria bambusicola]